MGREPDLSPRGPEPQLSRDPPSAPLAGTGFVWHSGSAGPRELYPGCTAIAQAPATSTTLQRCGCSVHLMGEETGSEAGPMCWSKSNPGQPISQFCPREGDQGVVPAGPGQPHRATRSWLGSSQHTRPSLPPTWGAALCAPRPDIHPPCPLPDTLPDSLQSTNASAPLHMLFSLPGMLFSFFVQPLPAPLSELWPSLWPRESSQQSRAPQIPIHMPHATQATLSIMACPSWGGTPLCTVLCTRHGTWEAGDACDWGGPTSPGV